MIRRSEFLEKQEVLNWLIKEFEEIRRPVLQYTLSNGRYIYDVNISVTKRSKTGTNLRYIRGKRHEERC